MNINILLKKRNLNFGYNLTNIKILKTNIKNLKLFLIKIHFKNLK